MKEIFWVDSLTSTLDYLRDLNLISIVCRFVLATLCGSVIGFERGKKQHAAGLRTHIVVCIGAVAVMLVNQYISLCVSPGSDPARMGAQVISGIGFLGAGTIVITGHNRGRQVKGLTTAAGLWASACMGLAVGIGFYEAALIMCLFLFLVIAILHKLDIQYFKSGSRIQIYVEYQASLPFSTLLTAIRGEGWRMTDLEHLGSEGSGNVAALVEVNSVSKSASADEVIELLRVCPGVLFAEEV